MSRVAGLWRTFYPEDMATWDRIFGLPGGAGSRETSALAFSLRVDPLAWEPDPFGRSLSESPLEANGRGDAQGRGRTSETPHVAAVGP